MGDQSSSAPWAVSPSGSTLIGATTYTGRTNTEKIVAFVLDNSIAAKICYDLSLSGFTDWWLPSTPYEIDDMYNFKTQLGLSGNYWSSDEFIYYKAYYYDMTNNYRVSLAKTDTNKVRAIRYF